jgi:hypothetical protein
MKAIVYTTLLLLLFSGCYQENKNKVETTQDITVFKNLIKNKTFIPSSIKWDTLNFLPQSEELLLHQNFPIFYFKDDSTLYLIKSNNEIHKASKSESDSIQLLVDNVEIFKGLYKISKKMDLISIYLKLEGNSTTEHGYGLINDTINIIDYKIPALYYNKCKYIIPTNLLEASYKDINKYIYNIPYPKGHESEMEPPSKYKNK